MNTPKILRIGDLELEVFQYGDMTETKLEVAIDTQETYTSTALTKEEADTLIGWLIAMQNEGNL